MADTQLISSLKTLLADVISVYFQSLGYHWNVEGPDFSQYHALFGEVADDIYSSIDPIAENVRKLDDYAPFMLAKLVESSQVDYKSVKPEPQAMCKELLKTNEQLVKSLNEAFGLATKANQQGIADFLAGRIDMHQKWVWQLRASSK